MHTTQGNIVEHVDYSKKWWVYIGLGLALFVMNVDLTIINVVIPVLGQLFKTSLSHLQWVNNAYSLAIAATLILTGRLADRYGHRLIFLLGILTFVLGSMCAGLSQHIVGVIVGRLIQGVGMAAVYGMLFILLLRAFPKHEHGMAVGLLIIFTGVGQALGPALGGWIIQHWGWRWAFFINAFPGAASTLLILLFCNKDQGHRNTTIHYPSALVFSLSFVLMVFALNHAQQWHLVSLPFLLCLFTGTAMLATLLLFERKVKDPFLDLSLYRNYHYRHVTWIRPAFQFNFASILFVVPLYLQNILGYSPATCGLILLAFTVFIVMASPLAGYCNHRFGPSVSIVLGYLLSCMAYGSFMCSIDRPLFPWFFIGLMAMGFNVGLMFSATNFLAVDSCPHEKRGLGFGMFSAVSMLFYSFGIAVTGYLLDVVSVQRFRRLSQAHHLHWPAGLDDKVRYFINGAHPLTGIRSLSSSHANVLQQLGRAAFDHAFQSLMLFSLILSILGLLLSFNYHRGVKRSKA